MNRVDELDERTGMGADLRLVGCSIEPDPQSFELTGYLLLAGASAPEIGQAVIVDLACHAWQLKLTTRVAWRRVLRGGTFQACVEFSHLSDDVRAVVLRLSTLGDLRHIRTRVRVIPPSTAI